MYELLSANEIYEDRAIAEAQMIDVCKITAPGAGAPVFNETTGQYVNPTRVVIYGPGAVDPITLVAVSAATVAGRATLAGKYRIQVRSDINSNAVESVYAEREWIYRTATLQLPIDGTGHIQTDYVMEPITAAYDEFLVGRQFNVQAESKGKTHATHRRFRLRELMG